MASFTACGNCRNRTIGDGIYRCQQCSKKYCDKCCGSGSLFGNMLYSGSPCPDCGTRNEARGTIQKDDDDDDDDD